MVKYHVNPDTCLPNLCRAQSSDACPYKNEDGSSVPHFATKNEARNHAENILSEKYSSFTSVTKAKAPQTKDPRVVDLLEKLKHVKQSDIGLEEIAELGAEFNNIVSERLNIDLDEFSVEEFDHSDFTRIGQENQRLLGELFKTGDLGNRKITGLHKDSLTEVLKILPNNVHRRVSGDFVTKIEPKSSEFDGTYSRGAFDFRVEVNEVSDLKIPKDVADGEFFSNEYDFWNENTIGHSVYRLKSKSGVLNPDINVKPYIDNSTPYTERDALVHKMLVDGLINADYRIQPGKEEQFEQEYPALAEQMKNINIVEDFYIGSKPKTSRYSRKSFSYRKVADSVKVKTPRGEVVIDKPVFQKHDKFINYDKHTITAVRNVDNSTLLHEYCHSIQYGLPTEREAFRAFTEGAETKTERFYDYYDVSSDKYMFNTNGMELFTRATEGLFYPGKFQHYLYGKENVSKKSKEIRNWITGVWLVISKED